MLNNNLHVSDRSYFVVACAVSSRPSITRVTRRLFSQFARSFGHFHLCLSISLPTSFLKCATKDLLMSTKATSLQVETLFLSCTKAWCFHFWGNKGIELQMILQIAPHVLWNESYIMHKKSHNVLNYTMHTEMSVLEEWRRTKASIITLTILKFPI